MIRKAIVWIFQATNQRNLTQEDRDIAKKKRKRENESLQYCQVWS